MSSHPASPTQCPPSSFLRLLSRLRIGDYLVAILFVGFAFGSTVWNQILFNDSSANRAARARVVVRNAPVAEFDLQRTDTVAIAGTLGMVTLAIGEGRVRVLASPCANQICVRQGAIHRAHQMLVCAPNHLAVLLLGVTKNDLDAVTF